MKVNIIWWVDELKYYFYLTSVCLLLVLDDLTGTGAGQDGIEGKEPGDSLDLGVLEGSGISGGEGMWECCRWSYIDSYIASPAINS